MVMVATWSLSSLESLDLDVLSGTETTKEATYAKELSLFFILHVIVKVYGDFATQLKECWVVGNEVVMDLHIFYP